MPAASAFGVIAIDVLLAIFSVFANVFKSMWKMLHILTKQEQKRVLKSENIIATFLHPLNRNAN